MDLEWEKNRKTGFSLVGCQLFFLSEDYSFLVKNKKLQRLSFVPNVCFVWFFFAD